MDYFNDSQSLLGVDCEDISFQMNFYNVSKKMYEESVQIIKDWFKLQPHLCHIEIDEWVLKKILVNMEFSVENAKIRIDNYYTARANFPEVYSDRNSGTERVLQDMDIIYFAAVPQKTLENYRVGFFGFTDDNVELLGALSFMKTSLMLAEIGLKLDSHSGYHFIFDCEHFTIGHSIKMAPGVKIFFTLLEDCYAHKIKGVHVMNTAPFAYRAALAVKAILPEKMAQRFHLHKNYDGLLEFFSRDLLPEDLGGKQPSRAELSERWKRYLRSPQWQQWFRESEKKMADNSKRLNCSHLRTDRDLDLGVQGTFRSLNID